MPVSDIALQRLYQQGLTNPTAASPAEVVSRLGAVQAQDYLGTKWSLAQRIANATDSEIEQAFNKGTILRTHTMRPTWHFVTPADIRWLQELTAPHVNAVNAYMYRQLELDEKLFAQANKAISQALQDRKQLTRPELGKALAQIGIVADGMRLGYILHRAELDALICSGPRSGKQFTYMLLDDRVPRSKSLPHEEALAELTLRYYAGHGPATVQDFVWWSGLSLADARLGLELVASHLDYEIHNENRYWFSANYAPVTKETTAAFLLAPYDEFFLGFSWFDTSRTTGQAVNGKFAYDSMIVCGGRLVGSWRRTFERKTVIIEIQLLEPLSSAENEAIRVAAEEYAKFAGMSLQIKS